MDQTGLISLQADHLHACHHVHSRGVLQIVERLNHQDLSSGPHK